MRALCILLMALMLSGCSATKYVYIHERVAVEIPNEMFIYPTIPSPINKDEYLSLDDREKELFLTKYIISLFNVIDDYKVVLQNIDRYSKDSQKVIERNITEYNDANSDR